MKISIVAGTRPNFIKVAPIIASLQRAIQNGKSITFRLIHTGQHYDDTMSGIFFKQLGIPLPDKNLACGSGTQAVQTASIMIEFEKDLLANPCDLLIVVGDVNSTMACTIVAKKLGVRVAHVEGGIRSLDMSMPEEINRLVTDSIADYFFTTTRIASENLIKSGIDEKRIFFVGNTMIDTLLANQKRLIKPTVLSSNSIDRYMVLTLHRPSNVDIIHKLHELLNFITSVANNPIVFPVHPRTKKMILESGYKNDGIVMVEPLSYLEFIYLVKHAICVITDSGGVQEETTVLGVPCITMRQNTERPETITMGTNELVGDDLSRLKNCVQQILNNNWKVGNIPELWDGKTSDRIIDIINQLDSRGWV